VVKVGLAAQALPMRFSPMAVTKSSYLSAVAARADSFWLTDHLNSLFPRAMAQPKYIGAARLTPKVDANLEPWTVLGHLAARIDWGACTLGSE
jgi:phthiodiolone/phenolphthiodiolone dimycocerosates ketoreductase